MTYSVFKEIYRKGFAGVSRVCDTFVFQNERKNFTGALRVCTTHSLKKEKRFLVGFSGDLQVCDVVNKIRISHVPTRPDQPEIFTRPERTSDVFFRPQQKPQPQQQRKKRNSKTATYYSLAEIRNLIFQQRFFRVL